MARKLTNSEASILTQLIKGDKAPSRLTPAVAVRLTQLGCLDLVDGKVVISLKGKKTFARLVKAQRQVLCDRKVDEVLTDILKEDGACTQHRQVWVAVGRNEFSRESVLTSLQSLRSEGTLKSFKSSTNNFQVFWARLNDEPTAGDFEVNGEAK